MQTRRQRILELILDQPLSLRELADHMDTGVGTIEHDLKHVARTAGSKGITIRIAKSICDNCNKQVKWEHPVRGAECPRCHEALPDPRVWAEQ